MVELNKKYFKVTVQEVVFFDDTREASSRNYTNAVKEDVYEQLFEALDVTELARFLNTPKA